MTSVPFKPLRVRHEPKRRMLQVLRVDLVSPRMRSIVLGGDELEGFNSAAPDDHVKLFFPARGEDKPALSAVGASGPTADGALPPVMRDYTPRHFDAAAGELTIEFVMHGDGPATRWASQAKPGQFLGVGGPRGSLLVSEAFDAYLLAGDETALPAIGRWLEEMRPGARAIVLIEVADEREKRDLRTRANASVTWLYRNGTAAGSGALLTDAIQSLAWPAGHMHAWLAGEIDTIRGLRTHLLEERRLPREHVRAAGYWRIGQADAHTRLED